MDAGIPRVKLGRCCLWENVCIVSVWFSVQHESTLIFPRAAPAASRSYVIATGSLPFATMDTPTNGRDCCVGRHTAKPKANSVHQRRITSSNAQGRFSVLLCSAGGNWLQYVSRLV